MTRMRKFVIAALAAVVASAIAPVSPGVAAEAGDLHVIKTTPSTVSKTVSIGINQPSFTNVTAGGWRLSVRNVANTRRIKITFYECPELDVSTCYPLLGHDAVFARPKPGDVIWSDNLVSGSASPSPYYRLKVLAEGAGSQASVGVLPPGAGATRVCPSGNNAECSATLT